MGQAMNARQPMRSDERTTLTLEGLIPVEEVNEYMTRKQDVVEEFKAGFISYRVLLDDLATLAVYYATRSNCKPGLWN